MDLKFGFSWVAFIAFALPMLPNIFYFLFPPMNIPENMGDSGIILPIIEHGSQAVFVMLTVFFVSKHKAELKSPYLLFMAVTLLLYYVCWARYFIGGRDYTLLTENLWSIPVPMIIFPITTPRKPHY